MANKKPVNNNRADRGKNKKSGNISAELTPEEQRTKLAKELGLKPKSKQVIDLMIDNPKLSQTEAYSIVHGTDNRKTANVNASKLLAKTSAQIYKASAVGKAKKRIVELVESGNENIALKASQDILDRTEGKATQKTESINKTVEVKLDLTGVRIGAHYVAPAENKGSIE